MATAGTMRIGEVAAATGVTVEALRYYERQGLLPPPPRTQSGVRRYGPDAVARVGFIKQAQRLGLTLKDIQQLTFAGSRKTRGSCAKIRNVLAERIADLDGRVAELQQFRQTLCEYLSDCDRALGAANDADCPTVQRLTRETS
jgi:DNA-binding transcriptional MerR regulator